MRATSEYIEVDTVAGWMLTALIVLIVECFDLV